MTEEFSADGSSRRLQGAQSAIRDAFFQHESGLFVLDCGPGAGKSVTADTVAAEDLARKHVAGVTNPEETLCLTSFSRDDAASILPGVEAALAGMAADPDAPVSLDEGAAAELGAALRGTDRVGTVDSVLGTVFEATADEVGFDGVPTVGEGADLAGVHGDAVAAVRDDDSLTTAFERVDPAYPDGRWDEDVDALLSTARRACRERRLDVSDLRGQLLAVVDGAYPAGPPESVGDVLRDVERFFGDAEREAVTERLETDADGDTEAVVAADADCAAEWRDAITAFCGVLESYLDAYDDACRARGVVAHVDVAHWVATFFEAGRYSGPFRERLRERYTDRLSTVVVDEAQDVSRAQHDALAPLVDRETRVLLVGDRNQSVYAWRNAQPSLFAGAVEDGEYFGIEWETHESAQATRSYRFRPGVATAIDTVFESVFPDPARGGGSTNEASAEPGADSSPGGREYVPLTTDREATAAPNLHVAAFDGRGEPGKGRWVDPPEGIGEAAALADCIASRLEQGAFGDDPGVTVLFQRRTHMASYIDAFTEAGLSVRDTSRALFDHPLVGAVCAVVEWLQAPSEKAATLTLVNDDDLPLNTLVDRLMRNEFSVQAVAEGGGLSGTLGTFTTGLAALAERRPTHLASGGADVVSDVVETLSLDEDPFDQSTAATDDTAVLDRLVATVADWEGDDAYSLARLAAALGHARRNARNGPSLPTESEAGGDADVTFRTIHNAKGDEDDVVAVADLGERLGRLGPQLDRALAHGQHVALAPPANLSTPTDYPELGGTVLADGPYDPSAGTDDDHAGLRWASQRWVPGEARIAGPPPLADAVAESRAERWRLLYVALSRARDHLVLPLPTQRQAPTPRDRWVDTLREAYAFDESRTGDYTVERPDNTADLAVAVHQPSLLEADEENLPTEDVRAELDPAPPVDSGWTPRFVSPSTMHALSTAPEAYVLDHLSGRALHADHEGVDDALPLSFETMGPDVVGDVAHDTFAVALRQGVDTDTLRSAGGPLPQAIDRAVATYASRVSSAEREQLRRYVESSLLPEVAETALWERLQRRDRHYVEEPLDGVARIGNPGLAVEIGGQADVVSVDDDGNWRVDDLKVALAPLTPELRERYELQAATYAWALARQPGVDDVTTTVTTVGAEAGSWTVERGDAAFREALDRLYDLRW